MGHEMKKTSSGFEYEVYANAKDDMELLDDLVDLQNDDISALKRIIVRLLGDRKKDLYDHCRGENGIVSIEKVAHEVNEILDGSGEEVKKS